MSKTELLVGDPAPEIRVSAYVKGTPISAFAPGTVYVVECWATWCGPCVRSIPHLTALQAAYPQATVLAVAVREPDPEKVRSFVEEKGDAIGYTVAIDRPPDTEEGLGWMHRNWCRAAYESSIPTAFIVDRAGRIAWIGHPMEIDEAFAAVVDGTWDLAARSQAHRDFLVAHKIREATAMNAEVERCRRAGDVAGAVRTYDEAFASHPELEAEWGLRKLTLLVAAARADVSSYARHLVDAVAPKHPELPLILGVTLLRACRSEAERFASPPDLTLAALAVDALLIAARQIGPESPLHEVAQVEENLAEVLLMTDRADEALRHASSARVWASKAGMAGALDRIEALIQRCEKAGGVLPLAPLSVACDDDASRLAQPTCRNVPGESA